MSFDGTHSTNFFKSKDEAKRFYRKILGGYQLGTQLTQEDFDLIYTLLLYHPEAQTKIGCGVERIIVEDDGFGGRCFHVVRKNGEQEPFSLMKCIDQAPPPLTKPWRQGAVSCCGGTVEKASRGSSALASERFGAENAQESQTPGGNSSSTNAAVISAGEPGGRIGVEYAKRAEVAPAKMDLVLKFSALEQIIVVQETPQSVTLKVKAENGVAVTFTIKPKMHKKFLDAIASFPLWMAYASGKLRMISTTALEISEPILQVFERKQKQPRVNEKPNSLPAEG